MFQARPLHKGLIILSIAKDPRRRGWAFPCRSFAALRMTGQLDLAQEDGEVVGVKPCFHGADGQAAEGAPAA